MVKPVESMSLGPLMHFICCEVSFFIRSNTMWNTMMVEKAVFKSIDSSLGRESKSVSRVNVYSSKNKTLPLPG